MPNKNSYQEQVDDTKKKIALIGMWPEFCLVSSLQIVLRNFTYEYVRRTTVTETNCTPTIQQVQRTVSDLVGVAFIGVKSSNPALKCHLVS